jgi:chorismate mutase
MNADLARLRAEIERIDRALVDLMRERVSTARGTAAAKRAAGLPTVDPSQEAAVIRRAAALARDAGLPAEDVRDVFWKLVALTRGAELEE